MAEFVLTVLGFIFLSVVLLALIGLVVAFCKLIWAIIHGDF